MLIRLIGWKKSHSQPTTVGCIIACKSWDIYLPYQLVQDFFHHQYVTCLFLCKLIHVNSHVHSLLTLHFPPIIWQQMSSSPSQFSSGLLPRNVEKEVANQFHRHKTSNEIYQSWAQRFQLPRTNKPWHRNGTDGHIKKCLRSNPIKPMCLCPLTSFQQKKSEDCS